MERSPFHGSVLLFDLFGTVVHFGPRVPVVEVAGERWRSTMGWLREAAARELPAMPFEDLLTALMQTTEAIVRERPPEYVEVPSRERFRRALLILGIAPDDAPVVARRLSLEHMRHLASTTVLRPGHVELLQNLAARYRLAIVSNFDHGPTAHAILEQHGIRPFFEAVVVSDDYGRRKPHPAIFGAAVRRMRVPSDQALFIGDSAADDVAGASRAGLAVVWINEKGEALPPGIPQPDYEIARLLDLPAVLRG
jgi:HAD superfamily hydrolase (TIGR01549 family)